jgi:hypothetical protein
MLENIPKEAEQLGLVGGVIGGAWLVFRAFVKKNITEKAEVNIYELQSKEIERLSVMVTANHDTIQLLHTKIMKIEVAQAEFVN